MSTRAFHLQDSWYVRVFCVLAFLGIAGQTTEVSAAGTYAEGMAIIMLRKIESKGWVYESYEGEAEWASYDGGEQCNEDQDQCYTPTLAKFRFSVPPENSKVVNFLRRNLDREMVIKYKIHQLEAVALSSKMEVLEAYPLADDPPADLKEKAVTKKTGSKRNFSLFGKVLRLEYQGISIGTYEGIYLDRTKRKVHSFSITEPAIAEYIFKAMTGAKEYYIGVSVAYATGARKSPYDIFEVNYKESAGGVYAEEPKKDEKKKDDKPEEKK